MEASFFHVIFLAFPLNSCYIENSELEIKELAYKGAYNIYGNPLPIKVEVRLKEPQRGITPGQSAVFYQGNRVIGGGKIERKK